MATQTQPWMTPAEYLLLERAAETKSEYIDGTLVAMSGVTRQHNLINVNLVRVLGNQLLERPCELYSQDMRGRIAEGGLYAYPDVAVVCGESEFEDNESDVLLNPTLIVEVLSDSTEAYDRGLKFNRYRQRASLREYVFVAQDRISVERYVREGDSWVLTEAVNLDDRLELSSIGCTLEMRDVYRRVDLVNQENAPDG